MVKPDYSKLSDLEDTVNELVKKKKDFKGIRVLESEAESTKKL